MTTTKTSEAVAQRLQQIKMLEEQLADLMSEKNKVIVVVTIIMLFPSPFIVFLCA